MKVSLCVIHGRFQLLHNGHIKNLVVPAFDYAERVVIGICNPEKDLTTFDQSNPHRSLDRSNPFSFWDRLNIFRAFLDSQNIPRERYEIVPFPINFPARIKNYAPTDVPYLLTIYDDWGRKKKDELEKQGFSVIVIKEMTLETKGDSGSEIRRMIAEGNPAWKRHVPEAVARHLIENNLLVKVV